ncbi:cytochrome P450 [Monaibacterium marinum]|nr:cytochrome P450 [Monaibacterium marinum]
MHRWARWRAFRRDMFASQPQRLYRAKMAQMTTPFYRSFTVPDPTLARKILEDAEGFPKSDVLAATLGDLLGRSVFVTNGAEWARARAMIDPAFSGGRVREMLPQMVGAGQRMLAELHPGVIEVEAVTARATADVILRVLFSRPIDDAQAQEIFGVFQEYQRAQPLASLADLLRLPAWVPRRRRGRKEAYALRALVADLIAQRQGDEVDLLARLIDARDGDDGTGFSESELVDQAVMFLLAGHETSASALSWALYCLALSPEDQDRAAAEVAACAPTEFKQMPFLRDVWREVLRLYPPVPMLPRQAAQATTLRERAVSRGDPVIISPWHSGRHEREWDRPHEFDPSRWAQGATTQGWFPFSAGPRICPGAGFATAEGIILLAMILREWRLQVVPNDIPQPVAHLTVRSAAGIRIAFHRRATQH